jgi:hypothetical protein
MRWKISILRLDPSKFQQLGVELLYNNLASVKPLKKFTNRAVKEHTQNLCYHLVGHLRDYFLII